MEHPPEILARFLRRWEVKHPFGYNAINHSHDWKDQTSGDAYCPICGLYRSQVEHE